LVGLLIFPVVHLVSGLVVKDGPCSVNLRRVAIEDHLDLGAEQIVVEGLNRQLRAFYLPLRHELVFFYFRLKDFVIGDIVYDVQVKLLVARVNRSDSHVKHARDVHHLHVGSNDIEIRHFFLFMLRHSPLLVKATNFDLDLVAFDFFFCEDVQVPLILEGCRAGKFSFGAIQFVTFRCENVAKVHHVAETAAILVVTWSFLVGAVEEVGSCF